MITEQLRRMAGSPNRISERLATGWYPSVRNSETGAVHHDRHVLIWTRNYESSMLEAADEIDRLRADLSAAVNDLNDERWTTGQLRSDRRRDEALVAAVFHENTAFGKPVVNGVICTTAEDVLSELRRIGRP